MPGLHPGRSAILAPGGCNNAEVPLFAYAPAGGRTPRRQRARALAAELTLATATAPLVIGKSLGSLVRFSPQ